MRISQTAVLLFTVAACGIQAQENRASLGGQVTDASKAIIPGAVVTVTSVETRVVLTVKTNSAGEWLAQNLLPGHYRFAVSQPGFVTTEHQPIELQVGDKKTLDTVLTVGGQNEVVTVQDTIPLIDTTAAVQGTVITQKQLEELPTQTNLATLLAGLTPGVIIGSSTGTAGHLWSNASASAITVNGSGSGTRAINYQLDGGTDANAGGQVAFVPPIDAVQEFKVTSDAYDASIGRQAAATISLQIKSGTKSFHGTLFEFNQNNFLNARSFGSTTGAPPVHYNEYGGTLGGPVWLPKLYDGRAKKTFFFYTFDGIRNIAPGSAGLMSLPNTAEKSGDFSRSFTAVVSGTGSNQTTTIYPARIYNPNSYNAATGLRSEYSGNNCAVASKTISGTIPSGVDPNSYLQARTCKVPVSPIAAAYFAHIPDVSPTANDGVNSDSNNFVKRSKFTDKMETHLVRVDQTWNDNHRSYVSLKYNTWNELGYNSFGSDTLLQGLYQTRVNRSVTMDHTWVIKPSLLLDLRFNIARWEGASYNPSVGADPTAYGFSSTLASQQASPALPQITGSVVGGSVELGGLGTSQSSKNQDTTYEYIANATQTVGSHALRYGFQFLNQQQGNQSLGTVGGSFGFDGTWTRSNPIGTAGAGEGSALASFTIGLPTSGSIPTNTTSFYGQHYAGVFLQDDWRVTPKFTLNMGLRWDYERPIQDRFDRMWARYDKNYVQTAITTAAQPGYAAVYNGATTSPGVAILKAYGSSVGSFVAKGGYKYAGVDGNPEAVTETRYKYFQPRLGFAYQWHPTTVVRGGLGRFVQGTFESGVSAQQNGFSSSTGIVPTSDSYRTVTQGFSLANPFPNGLNLPTGNSLRELTFPGAITGYRDPSYGRPYTDTASAQIQQQMRDFLVEIGGTLNITHGLSVTDPLNGNSGGFQDNMPSQATWVAEYSPTFSATGRPDDTLPANLTVANPFYHGPNFQTTASQYTSTTVAVNQLVRPNPIRGDIIRDAALGKNIYYALNTKVERRYHNGFSLLQAFTWAKGITESNFVGPQGYAEVIERRLSSSDIKFHYTLTPIYVLPFGKGKFFLSHVNRAMEQVVGGWELTGIYNFQSGTPVVLPANSSFFYAQGGSPSGAPRGRTGTWFNTDAFRAYPTKNTPNSTLQQYPSWTGVTGLQGYGYQPTSTSDAQNGVYQDFTTRVTYNQTTFGDIRQPFLTNFDIGVRKNFNLTEVIRLELRMDAFNALNHPRFGGIGTDPTSLYFGRLSGSATLVPVNNPRQLQLSGKFFF